MTSLPRGTDVTVDPTGLTVVTSSDVQGAIAELDTAASTASYTDEQVRDVIGAALVAGTGITLTVNDAGDTITVAAGASLHVSESFHTAAAGDGILTLSQTPYEESLQVFVNGLLKRKATDYTVAGNVVTFGSALSAGQVVCDRYLTTVASPADSSLSTLPVNISDAFNRADNASSLGTTDTGQTWTAGSGTWGIASNKARCFSAGNQSFAVVDAGVADCTIAVTVSNILTNGGGISFRYVDVNNVWFVEMDTVQTILYLVQTGSYTGVVSGMPTFTAGDVMSVVLSGTSITVKKNGSTIGSTTSSFNSTATKHGLRDYGAGVRFDDFSIT